MLLRLTAASLVALLGCALPPPVYEKWTGTPEEFDITKHYCLELSQVQLRIRPGASDYPSHSYETYIFETCMSQFGWARTNRGEPTRGVFFAQPVFSGE